MITILKRILQMTKSDFVFIGIYDIGFLLQTYTIYFYVVCSDCLNMLKNSPKIMIKTILSGKLDEI